MTNPITTQAIAEINQNMNLMFKMLTHIHKTMATKSELAELRVDVQELKVDIQQLKTDAKSIKLTLSDNGLEPNPHHRQLFKRRPA